MSKNLDSFPYLKLVVSYLTSIEDSGPTHWRGSSKHGFVRVLPSLEHSFLTKGLQAVNS